ncbi:TRAM domain-containing protein [Ammonicoccus fulvus]|uniref:TRAM domain-containing protein n=1 Tax=Ammonicoccus fulvus TaxID=3138240 RepID=A0ABZ3FS18_9ACTN
MSDVPVDPIGPVEVGDVAHGGHCVARHDGRVIFVRHALPGETVRVRITDTSHDRFWRGDAVEIVVASPDRRTPPCPVFHPGGCGGCDFQHATEEAQRELKRRVVAEQVRRLGGVDWEGVVEAVEPVWGWRTRMRYQSSGAGLGLKAHRSHDVVPLPDQGCAIAVVDPRTLGEVSAGGDELLVVSSADGVNVGSPRDRGEITEHAAGRDFTVDFAGFWQGHPAAADTLVDAVIEGLDPAAGEKGFDLYCGVGLFAGALADREVSMWGVESAKSAVNHARRNVPGARFTVGRVEKALRDLPGRTDLVVLDPPRAGAGRAVMEQISRRQPRAIAYVACDPAALGRDLAYARELGWEVRSLRAFDLFPQTHHIECVAILQPAAHQ